MGAVRMMLGGLPITSKTLLLLRTNVAGNGFIDASPYNRAIVPNGMSVGAAQTDPWSVGKAMSHGITHTGYIGFPSIGRRSVFTIDGWYKPTLFSGDQRSSYADPVSDMLYSLRVLSSGAAYFYVGDGISNSVKYVQCSPSFTLNAWRHVLVVLSESSGVRIYFSGSLAGQISGPITFKNIYGYDARRHGGHHVSESASWLGYTDEFRITDGDATSDPDDACYIANGQTAFAPPSGRYTS